MVAGLVLMFTGLSLLLGVCYKRHLLMIPYLLVELLANLLLFALVFFVAGYLMTTVSIGVGLVMLALNVPFMLLSYYFYDVVLTHYQEVRGDRNDNPGRSDKVAFAYQEMGPTQESQAFKV